MLSGRKFISNESSGIHRRSSLQKPAHSIFDRLGGFDGDLDFSIEGEVYHRPNFRKGKHRIRVNGGSGDGIVGPLSGVFQIAGRTSRRKGDRLPNKGGLGAEPEGQKGGVIGDQSGVGPVCLKFPHDARTVAAEEWIRR